MYMADSFSDLYPLLHLVNATHLCKKKTNLVVAICPAAAREQTVCGR